MESVAEILVFAFEDWGGDYPEGFSLLVLKDRRPLFWDCFPG